MSPKRRIGFGDGDCDYLVMEDPKLEVATQAQGESRSEMAPSEACGRGSWWRLLHFGEKVTYRTLDRGGCLGRDPFRSLYRRGELCSRRHHARSRITHEAYRSPQNITQPGNDQREGRSLRVGHFSSFELFFSSDSICKGGIEQSDQSGHRLQGLMMTVTLEGLTRKPVTNSRSKTSICLGARSIRVKPEAGESTTEMQLRGRSQPSAGSLDYAVQARLMSLTTPPIVALESSAISNCCDLLEPIVTANHGD